MLARGHQKEYGLRVLFGLSLALFSAGITSCHETQPQKVAAPASEPAATSGSVSETKASSAVIGIPSSFQVPSDYQTEQRPWKARSGYTLLLAKGPSSAVAGTAILGLAKDGGVVAQATDKDENCDLPQDSLYSGKDGTACEVTLDLAPYRIGDNEFAFGTRWKENETFPAGESNAEELRLWRVDAGKLRKILETRMEDSDEQRGPNEESDTKCTLSVSEEKTLDYFDLLKRCAASSGPLIDDPETHQATGTKKSSSRTLFKWDGSKYAEQKGGAGR